MYLGFINWSGLILITLDLDDCTVMIQEPYFQPQDQYFTF